MAVRRRPSAGGRRVRGSLSKPAPTPILHPMSDASFTNQLLVAMPALDDPNFAQAVTLICEHTDKGALGIVLNKPLPMKLLEVLQQMQLEPVNTEIGAK